MPRQLGLFAVCVLLALLPIIARPDDPTPHLRDQAETVYDLVDAASAAAVFGNWVFRDDELPTKPIVKVRLWG